MDRVPARIRFFAAASFAQGRQMVLVRLLRKGINENRLKAFGFKPEDRLHSILPTENSPVVGQPLADFAFDGVVVTALARDEERHLRPSPEIRLQTGDALVLFGTPDDLRHAERSLLG